VAPRAISSSFEVAKAAHRSWSDHRAIRIGAGVAYYWLFAIVPLAALAVHLAGFFFSNDDIANWAINALGALKTTDPNSELTELVENLLERSRGMTFGLVGAIATAISASFAFAATQDAVNMVFDAPRIRGFRENALRRLILFVATVAVASLLVIMLIATALVGTLESFLPGSLLDTTFDIVSDFAVYAVGVGLVTAAFRFMPWPSIGWRGPMVSGAITVVALSLATWGYSEYLSRTQQASLAGAAGSVLASLVWMYVLAQVFVAGAELTRVLHVRWDAPEATPDETDTLTADPAEA
jgi:membrane protein